MDHDGHYNKSIFKEFVKTLGLSKKKLLLFYSPVDFLAFTQPQYDLEIDSVIQIILYLISSLPVPVEYCKIIDQLTQFYLPLFLQNT